MKIEPIVDNLNPLNIYKKTKIYFLFFLIFTEKSEIF